MNSTYISTQDYSESFLSYKRRLAIEVNIGGVPLGGRNPIRIQSMTTTDTMDTMATVAQSIRMIEAGSDYVRITAPSLEEAKNLENIKRELRKAGFNTPLIADIHFTPNAAELAARIVEKVRINPGNYVDKKKFEIKEYSDSAYDEEMERIRNRFSPLVKICKDYGTAMRIGTNHGSLSDRIMNRYGDTPEGMVESAMEFLRICESLSYHQIVLSMKSSNPLVMMQAYRILVCKMQEEGMNYPLHLGVTEAGEGEEGRIKSALGIGTLLEEGLGDTIRVSLTEDPEYEIPVCKNLIRNYELGIRNESLPQRTTKTEQPISNLDPTLSWSPFVFKRRETNQVSIIGGHQVPRVFADFSFESNLTPEHLDVIDYHYDSISDKWNMGEHGSDFIYLGQNVPDFMLPNAARAVYDYETWRELEDKINTYPLYKLEEFISSDYRSDEINFVCVEDAQIPELVSENNKVVLVVEISNFHQARSMFFQLEKNKIKNPAVIKMDFSKLFDEEFLISSSVNCGGILADGFGDGLFISYKNFLKLANRTAFNILQATRSRISKTEYISCPSCGRTLFDLQKTTAMIREATDHLKGVKIAIMGCIVNGPGEMADADFGYVGTGVNKITLYKGKEVVRRNIESSDALNQLIELIREEGSWVEKPSQATAVK